MLGLATLGVSSIAAASQPGWYVGGQLGWTQQNFSAPDFTTQLAAAVPFSSVTSSSNELTKNGLGGNVYGGYQFNNCIGLEMGYNYLSKAHSNTSVTGLTAIGVNPPGAVVDAVNAGTAIANLSNQYQAIDLVGKLIWPITDTFDLHAKLGGAYAFTRQSADGSEIFGTTVTSISVPSESTNKFVPAVGAGGSYDFTDNVSFDVDVMDFVKTGDLPNAYFAGAGLSYYFG